MIGYQLHKATWNDCQKCDLCEGRTKVVLARGKLPCDVLFVGEAPGKSEDVLGKPFVGEAGKLFDQIIAEAVPSSFTYALTNLVACMPELDDDGKVTLPSKTSIVKCAPRLLELIKLASPKLIIAVGQLSWKWLPTLLDKTPQAAIPRFELIHPAVILRMHVTQKGLEMQLAVSRLYNAVTDPKYGLTPF